MSERDDEPGLHAGDRALALVSGQQPARGSVIGGSANETAADLGLTAIGPVGSDRRARDWALVLQSMSIWHQARRSSAGWFLLVRDGDYARAAASIDRYEIENRDWPPAPARERLRYPFSAVAPLVFIALCAFFFLVQSSAGGGARWYQQGTAVAELVVGSQPWRAVTALTLHGSPEHVVGNAISGTLFASAVYRRLGPGGGSLAVLAAGALGNVANAVWHHGSGHASIGASTAVLGAVGVLAATQLLVERPARAARRTWIDVAGPIVGGLALLGAVGASPKPNVDLYAHLFGFLAGLVVGAAAALPRRLLAGKGEVVRFGDELGHERGGRWWVQPLLGALALGIVVGAWQLALRR